jgi:hypothetical protein
MNEQMEGFRTRVSLRVSGISGGEDGQSGLRREGAHGVNWVMRANRSIIYVVD